MASVTLQVLDGADRGVVFDDIATPMTIGREEGNTIQLNDERISRFHVKIQEDRGKIVLTDLESTNGTRVNGLDTQLRILQVGDLIAVGRSTLLYGAREEIANRVEELRRLGRAEAAESALEQITGPMSKASADPDESVSIDLDWSDDQQFPGSLHLPGPPALPEGLSPAQAAEVAEMVEYFHKRVGKLLSGVESAGPDTPVSISRVRWHELVDLQAELARYLRGIGEAE